MAELVKHATRRARETEALLKEGKFEEAAAAADDVLEPAFGPVEHGLVRGRALLAPLLAQLEDESKPDPGEGAFREAWVMFQLALRFVPENEDAQEEVARLQGVVSELSEEDAPSRRRTTLSPTTSSPSSARAPRASASRSCSRASLASTLGKVPRRRARLWATFRRWPKEMRFISPSFNSQGWTHTLTGGPRETNELNVRAGTEVTAVTPRDGGFDVAVVPRPAASRP
ncbi:pyridine nucleotide-disulfide oxidoreductase [Aureococcus anophagefferens]|nr:pyridine nucleotide-disulfide oxidoreductase [Aureococcus anophagefferens]